MIYTSVGDSLRLGRASSSDGYSWQGVETYSFIETDAHDPYILENNGEYVLYFATTPPGDKTRIMSINFDKDLVYDSSTLKEIISPSIDTDKNGASSPVVYKDNDIYYLFYSGLGNQWSIDLSTSIDGISFNKCPFQILSNDTVPKSIYKFNGYYYLFFHSSNGIEYVETDHLGCDSVWQNRTQVLPYGYFPSVLKHGNDLWLYYSTRTSGGWRLNLAISRGETAKKPTIIIPGMFASWNKNALFYNMNVPQSAWSVNPIVQEYTGITGTLDKLGYISGTDYFVFPYDWRQGIEKTADELDVFINGLDLETAPDIVGHSLGGLAARIYAQKHGTGKVNKVVTLGSPHSGTTQVYKAVEGGDTDMDDPYWSIAQEIILQLNRNGLQTDKQIVENRFPAMRNILPINDFLVNSGQPVSISTMKIQNNLLTTYASNTGLDRKLHAIAGETGNTLSGFEVETPSVLETLLDMYPDGKPVKGIYAPGDYVITKASALTGDNALTISQDHGRLVYSKEGIGAVLDTLEIPHEASEIVEGKATVLFPSIIFLMLSPARLSVQKDGITYPEKDGMVFIENAQSGSYQLQAQGLENGPYTILIGELKNGRAHWSRIEGVISSEDPTAQTDTYTVTFTPQNNITIQQPADSMFGQLIKYLTESNKKLKKSDITKAIGNLNKAKTYHMQNNKGRLKSQLLLVQQQLTDAYTKTAKADKYTVMKALDMLEDLYATSLNTYTSGVIASRLKKSLAKMQALMEPSEKHLSFQKSKGKNMQSNAMLLKDVRSKLQSAQTAYDENRYNAVDIKLRNIEQLMKAVLKI